MRTIRILMFVIAVGFIADGGANRIPETTGFQADTHKTLQNCRQADSPSLVYGYGWVARPVGCV